MKLENWKWNRLKLEKGGSIKVFDVGSWPWSFVFKSTTNDGRGKQTGIICTWSEGWRERVSKWVSERERGGSIFAHNEHFDIWRRTHWTREREEQILNFEPGGQLFVLKKRKSMGKKKTLDVWYNTWWAGLVSRKTSACCSLKQGCDWDAYDMKWKWKSEQVKELWDFRMRMAWLLAEVTTDVIYVPNS